MRLIKDYETSENVSRLVKCRRCSHYYLTNTRHKNQRCLVKHPPGSCCHYKDTRLEENDEGMLEDANGNTYSKEDVVEHG